MLEYKMRITEDLAIKNFELLLSHVKKVFG